MLQRARNLGVSCAMNIEDSARAKSEFEQPQASCCPLYLQKFHLSIGANEENLSPLAARTCCIFVLLKCKAKAGRYP